MWRKGGVTFEAIYMYGTDAVAQKAAAAAVDRFVLISGIGVDHPRYPLRLAELALIDRERRMAERRIKAARLPAVKRLDSFDFIAISSLNKTLALELARAEYVGRRKIVVAIGNSGTGKTRAALGCGLADCKKGLSTSDVHRAAWLMIRRYGDDAVIRAAIRADA